LALYEPLDPFSGIFRESASIKIPRQEKKKKIKNKSTKKAIETNKSQSKKCTEINYMRLLMGEYCFSNYARRVLLNASTIINTTQNVRIKMPHYFQFQLKLSKTKKEKKNETTR
jgi:hypothetical protein